MKYIQQEPIRQSIVLPTLDITVNDYPADWSRLFAVAVTAGVIPPLRQIPGNLRQGGRG